jgi:hypothetical protein
MLTRKEHEPGTMPDEDIEVKMRHALGTEDAVAERVHLAELANQRSRERRFERRAASRRADLAAAEARSARIRSQVEKEDEDLRLSQHGLRRSFWTGRIIPVNSSRRARAHARRLSKGRYATGGE